jgi:WD40 repeat protein
LVGPAPQSPAARTGQVTRQFPVGGRFALSPDGRQAAIGVNTSPDSSPTTSLVTLDLSTGKEGHLQSLPGSTWMATLQYTPNGKSVVGGSLDGDVRVWNLASASIVQTFVSQSGGRTQVAVDPTGRTVVSGADDGSVLAWDLAGGQALGRSFVWSTPDNSCPSYPCFAVNPAGTIMANDETDGTVDLVDLRTLDWYATLPATKGLVANGLAFTPGGELVTGDEGGNITFWDPQTRAVLRKLRVADPVNFLAVSPDGKLLALQMQAADSSNTVVAVIDLATGATVHSYTVPDGSGGVAFSPDGRELAALGCCTPGSTVDLWDTASGQRLPGPHITGQLQSIAFSPASPVLGIGTADGKVYLWDAARQMQLGAPVTIGAANVLVIAFSPDGKLLAGSLWDGSTILVDVPSRQPLGNSFAIEGGVFTAPLFTATGDLLIDYVGTATDWPTDLGAWERYACQVAGRDITPTEWANVLADRPYEHVCPP